MMTAVFEDLMFDGGYLLLQMACAIPFPSLKAPLIDVIRAFCPNPDPKVGLMSSTSPDYEPGLLLKMPALCREHSPPLS